MASVQTFMASLQTFMASLQSFMASGSFHCATIIMQGVKKHNDKSPVHVQQLPVSTFQQDLLIHYVGDVGSYTSIRPFMTLWLVDCGHYHINMALALL